MSELSNNAIQHQDTHDIAPTDEGEYINAFDHMILGIFGMVLVGTLIWFTVGP